MPQFCCGQLFPKGMKVFASECRFVQVINGRNRLSYSEVSCPVRWLIDDCIQNLLKI